ncbi:hypothetical protein HPP92_002240 [Vanilla planifolia]|uniref:Autophagy protein ATG5 alpha-helical bundle region domain-containing protein n=1 Tax=Vanilla planifolia TaxID=51239 RepID=A0A835S418_VANPL|nr:hypothetical protein HPP92_002240 [Vanilla planifolia]
MELLSEQAMRYVWEGAIPLQIFLHESEVTTLPPPPPVMEYSNWGFLISYVRNLRPWNLTAAYIINGNCKNIMNMSQADQSELWQSLIKGNMDGYARVSSRLKIGPFGDDAAKPTSGNESTGTARSSRIPVRLYLRVLGDDEDDLEDVTAIDSWDSVSYINRPVEIHRE